MSFSDIDFILADDVMLPSQYYGRRLKDDGYRKLHLAVLFDALTDLKLHNAEIVGNAIDWIMDDDDRLPFTYRTCCEVSNINADQLRSWLVKMCIGGQMNALRIRNDSIETGPVKGYSQAKTHCVNGHEWNEETTVMHESRLGVYRRCRLCHNATKNQARDTRRRSLS